MWFLAFCIELSAGCIISSPWFMTVYSTVWNYDSTKQRELITCTQCYSHCSTSVVMWTKLSDAWQFACPYDWSKDTAAASTHLSWPKPGPKGGAVQAYCTPDLLRPVPPSEATHTLFSNPHGCLRLQQGEQGLWSLSKVIRWAPLFKDSYNLGP